MIDTTGRAGTFRLRPVFALTLAIPLILYASASGPEPASNADPYGSTDACARSGCHVGTAVNGGGGRIAFTSLNGSSYTPGVAQTFTLTITDSAARVYGFQISALSQGSNQQAGSFTRGAGQFVICANNLTKPTTGCPASAPVEYLEHAGASPTGIFTITWTPDSNVGPVVFYFAGNAANGSGTADRGDHIYTGTFTLGAPAGTPKPVISAAISAGAFGASDIFTGGSWIEIYGTNLAATTRQWTGEDFGGVNAPTTLDGVSVTINNRPAYVWVLVHGATDQLNVQAPTDGAISGKASIVVTVNGQTSAAFTMFEDARLAPGLLAPDNYRVGGKQYIVGLFSDGKTYGCPPGAFAGLNCKLPKAGDQLTFYGVGFGATANAIPAGMIAPNDSRLANSLTWQFGTTTASVPFAGLVPGAVGLYQFNVVVPNLPAGDYLINVRVGGLGVPQTMSLQLAQ